MSFLAELQARRARLRPTETEDKSRSFLDRYDENVSFSKKYIETFFEVNMDNWYEHVIDFTPRTEFIPLSKAICKLLHTNHGIFMEALRSVLPEDVSPTEESEITFEASKPLIAERIQQMRTELFFESFFSDLEKMVNDEFGGAVFVKTSSRSPKDVTMNSVTYFSKELRETIGRMSEEGGEDDLMQRQFQIYREINKIGTGFLKCNSASQAIELLLRSNRVMEDFETFIFEGTGGQGVNVGTGTEGGERGEGEATTTAEEEEEEETFQLVLREWDDAIDPDFEFRCFVCEGKLTAVSQYNFLSPNDVLVRYTDQMLALMTDFFETRMRERLAKITSYVIDFAIRNDVERLFTGVAQEEDEKWVILIELNPFQFSTGTCMFDWKKDDDVLHGRQPFEFRIQTAYDQESFAKAIEENVSERYRKYFEM